MIYLINCEDGSHLVRQTSSSLLVFLIGFGLESNRIGGEVTISSIVWAFAGQEI